MINLDIDNRILVTLALIGLTGLIALVKPEFLQFMLGAIVGDIVNYYFDREPTDDSSSDGESFPLPSDDDDGS